MAPRGVLEKKESSPITLVLVRSPGANGRRTAKKLEKRLEEIAERYAPNVVVLSSSPSRLPKRYKDHAGPSPTVLVLRNDEIICETMGDLFPTKELDRVVRRAVEWPST